MPYIFWGVLYDYSDKKKNAENDFLKLWLLKVHLRAIELWRVPNYFLSFSHKYIYQKSVTA